MARTGSWLEKFKNLMTQDIYSYLTPVSEKYTGATLGRKILLVLQKVL
jgi:hypothetical protein